MALFTGHKVGLVLTFYWVSFGQHLLAAKHAGVSISFITRKIFNGRHETSDFDKCPIGIKASQHMMGDASFFSFIQYMLKLSSAENTFGLVDCNKKKREKGNLRT